MRIYPFLDSMLCCDAVLVLRSSITRGMNTPPTTGYAQIPCVILSVTESSENGHEIQNMSNSRLELRFLPTEVRAIPDVATEAAVSHTIIVMMVPSRALVLANGHLE
jgi:hypothetical protein